MDAKNRNQSVGSNKNLDGNLNGNSNGNLNGSPLAPHEASFGYTEDHLMNLNRYRSASTPYFITSTVRPPSHPNCKCGFPLDKPPIKPRRYRWWEWLMIYASAINWETLKIGWKKIQTIENQFGGEYGGTFITKTIYQNKRTKEIREHITMESF